MYTSSLPASNDKFPTKSVFEPVDWFCAGVLGYIQKYQIWSLGLQSEITDIIREKKITSFFSNPDAASFIFTTVSCSTID